MKLLIDNSYAAYDISGDAAYLDLNAELPQWQPGNYCAVLSGVLAATYVHRRATVSAAPGRAGIMANVGSVLAVGCPVCNKLVVAAIGVSGALNVWAPIQPLIAAASLALLGWALWRRLTALRSCPVGGDGVLSPAVTMSGSAPERDS